MAALANAHAFLAIQREFGTFDRYLWVFVGADRSSTRRARSSVNAELNCHFFADADVPRLTNSLFLAPDTIAGCVGSYAVPPPDDFAESRAGAAVFSGAC